MARFPGAAWVGPTPNKGLGGMRHPVMGLVLHITSGSIDGAIAWNKRDDIASSRRGAAHFYNPRKGGPLRQLTDTDDRPWAQGLGNDRWVSLENEGLPGDSLTENQLNNAAALMRWLHETDDVPYAITNDPNHRGLGFHGMGGTGWGGHPNCPGEPIKSQRADILRRAQGNPMKEAMAAFPNAVDACIIPNWTGVKGEVGVWVAGIDGGVGAYPVGKAPYIGSIPGLGIQLVAPVVKIVPYDEPGKGYGFWLVAADNGIFAFGSAPGLKPYTGFFAEYRKGVHAIVSAQRFDNGIIALANDGAFYAAAP